MTILTWRLLWFSHSADILETAYSFRQSETFATYPVQESSRHYFLAASKNGQKAFIWLKNKVVVNGKYVLKYCVWRLTCLKYAAYFLSNVALFSAQSGKSEVCNKRITWDTLGVNVSIIITVLCLHLRKMLVAISAYARFYGCATSHEMRFIRDGRTREFIHGNRLKMNVYVISIFAFHWTSHSV